MLMNENIPLFFYKIILFPFLLPKNGIDLSLIFPRPPSFAAWSLFFFSLSLSPTQPHIQTTLYLSYSFLFSNCLSFIHPQMSSFGTFFRITTFGESHGGGVGCIVEGVPPRMALTPEDIQKQLDRRRPGQSAVTTSRQEPDRCEILSGFLFA